LDWEAFLFKTAVAGLLFSVLASLLAVILKRVRRSQAGPSPAGFTAAEKAALFLSLLVLTLLTVFLVLRAVRVGHGPFTGMFEFSAAFVWGILLMSQFFSWKYGVFAVNLFGTSAGAVLLLYAGTLPSEASPLVPALQNSLLLSAHVFSAVIAYGAFTVGFLSSLMYLVQERGRFRSLPDAQTLERISYHSVVVGFSFMTLVIVLGALWADIAWGRYWGWDPKETASLVTWLLYAVYLHTRILKNWKGRKSAVLLIIGFAAVLFTFFGNYLFSGLHSYT
jgi:cytochrome c-type biogenesis protein CcsB